MSIVLCIGQSVQAKGSFPRDRFNLETRERWILFAVIVCELQWLNALECRHSVHTTGVECTCRLYSKRLERVECTCKIKALKLQ